MKKDYKKLIILDLDGTLYSFKNGSFKKSGIYDAIIKNTKKYIKQKLKVGDKAADSIIKEIIKNFGDSISIGLEKRYGFDRYDYFNYAWDLPANKYIFYDHNIDLRKIFLKLRKKFKLAVVSDAPLIWVNKVLEKLLIKDIFDKKYLFSGEGDIRKEFNNAFQAIIKKTKIKPSNCVVFGDQLETDIVPAKKVGMKTVYVGNKKQALLIADYVIKSINEIEKALKVIKFYE